jgi:prepilin-type N-terminal cleavage/methylation domain-containing protein
MLRKFTNRKGFTLVELMIVVAIIGILAAIAIPAFLRSVKKSKTAESEQNMKKIAEGAKTYFMGEQKVEPAQPWHDTGVTADYGLPVPWASYVFPGGDEGAAASGIGSYQTFVDVPTGGSKNRTVTCATLMCTATLNKLGVDFKDPLYFRYTYRPTGSGVDASVSIAAEADFKVGDGIHTTTQFLRIEGDTQEVQVTPPFTANEFE